jgi:hypothetical protein
MSIFDKNMGLLSDVLLGKENKDGGEPGICVIKIFKNKNVFNYV